VPSAPEMSVGCSIALLVWDATSGVGTGAVLSAARAAPGSANQESEALLSVANALTEPEPRA